MIYISIAMGLYNFSFAGKQIMEQICQEWLKTLEYYSFNW
jgi:hypothetical protein